MFTDIAVCKVCLYSVPACTCVHSFITEYIHELHVYTNIVLCYSTRKLQTSAGEAPDDVRMMSEAKVREPRQEVEMFITHVALCLLQVGHCMQYEALLVRHLREQEALGRQACSETGMERNTMKKQNERWEKSSPIVAMCWCTNARYAWGFSSCI